MSRRRWYAAGRDDLDVLEGLEALAGASLVQAAEQPDGELRFAMLETVREFGLERLTASGEADALGCRYADYYLALAQAGATALADAAPGGWLAGLEVEQANLRAALTWLRDRGMSGTGLRLVAALGGFWHVHGDIAEGRTWLEAFLERAAAGSAPLADRVAASNWAGELAGLQGDLEAAQTHLTESLALARRTGDTRGVGTALRSLGSALLQHGDVADSMAPFAEAAALMRELGDLRQTAYLLAYLAYAVGHQGDLARGEALASESEDVARVARGRGQLRGALRADSSRLVGHHGG